VANRLEDRLIAKIDRSRRPLATRRRQNESTRNQQE
jgi:hypothetical protein